MTDPDLPPFSGEETVCIKCGNTEATVRYRAHGMCLHDAIDDVLGYEPNERLHRECTRCRYSWDEAVLADERMSLDDVFASMRERVEAQGGTWPPKAPPGLRMHPTGFTGILAVLHTTSSDRRRLGEPGPELTRPLPLPLVRPGESGIGHIDRMWRDGDLIRYSGRLNDSHPDAEKTRSDIRAGRIVGALDADNIAEDGMKLLHQGRVLSKEEVAALPIDASGLDLFETELSGWRVTAVTLMPAEGKAWPEVSLTLNES